MSTPVSTPAQKTVIESTVEYDRVDPEKIVAQAPQEKTIPNTTSKYNEIPIMYNFGVKETPILNDFQVEGPELYSPTGITSSVQNGKESWSILVALQVSK